MKFNALYKDEYKKLKKEFDISRTLIILEDDKPTSYGKEWKWVWITAAGEEELCLYWHTEDRENCHVKSETTSFSNPQV
jgi:hypothetical protein